MIPDPQSNTDTLFEIATFHSGRWSLCPVLYTAEQVNRNIDKNMIVVREVRVPINRDHPYYSPIQGAQTK